MITRLSDLRHVKVNAGFLDMTGYTRDAVIGRSVYEVDVLAGARDRELAVPPQGGRHHPADGGVLALPRRRPRFVIVAGQPIEMGDAPCMLFTFADLEDRRKAETALRQSEERFATAFRMSPVPSVLARADDLDITSVNQAFTRVFGLPETGPGEPRRPLALGRRGPARGVLGAARAAAHRWASRRACRRAGPNIDCLVSAERVTSTGGRVRALVLQDITRAKRSERELITAIEAVMADTSWFSQG